MRNSRKTFMENLENISRSWKRRIKVAVLTPLAFLVLSGIIRNLEYIQSEPGLKAMKTAQGEVYFIKDTDYQERK